MKKIALSFITIATFCYSNFIFAEMPSRCNWTGFYLGANAGYWRSQTNKITTTGTTTYINPIFALGASNVANALTQFANTNSSQHPNGFIGGVQAGYDYATNNNILLGLAIDFDGLTNSSNTFTKQKTVNLVDFNESYMGSLAVEQRINFLGSVRARLGFLYNPSFLIYATGGFAYGNVTLDSAWAAQESLGPVIFPTIAAQRNLNETLTGWTAGAGIEWLFKPNWSAMIEYSYYSLQDLNARATLAQINGGMSPSLLWASASVNTAMSLSAGSIRVGINYHF